MKRKAALAGLGLLLTMGGASCSGDDDKAARQAVGDNELVDYLDREFGLRMVIVSSNETVLDDGAIRLEQTLRVQLAGHGTRDILIDQTVWSDAFTSLFITDLETEAQRYLAWQVDDGFIVLGTNDQEVGQNVNVEVVPFPGGQFGVGRFSDDEEGANITEPTGNGRAAVDAVEASLGFRDLPPHMLMTAFALAHTTAPEARSPIQCSTSSLGMAAAPTVCAVFEDFCNCAPCLVLGDQAVCDKWCPGG
ncbi:MAG: hypothetical protein H6706_12545 [Myxococcales bacterium]|nr:hypothetical protein [Myxococcales bacterium]